MARGTTSKVRRGTEATWQSPGGPRGVQEAHSCTATWPGGHATTRVHVDARVGRHVGGRLVGGGPTGIVGPWLDIRGGNALALNCPPIYTCVFPLFFPCGTMFPRNLFCR